jgi:hypothetical protein
MIQLTARQLNRSTIVRQALTARVPRSVEDAVRHLVALQAQEPASPYLALWNRLDAFHPAALDTALHDRSIVKSNAVRMTLHLTHADDYPQVREATEPTIRAARLRDARFTVAGLTDVLADALANEMLAVAHQPRTSDELSAWLADRLGDAAHPGAWWGLRQYSPLLRAPTDAPWSFSTKTSYVAPRVVPRLPHPAASEESLRSYILRYLTAFGPASVADMAVFMLIQRGRLNAAVKALGDQLVRYSGPNGEALCDVPNGPIPDEDLDAPPRLLGMWDNVLLAYHDRGRVIPPEYRRTVIRINGDVLPTLLVDGYVAGLWRATDAGIEARPLHPLPEEVWDALAEEAVSLQQFIADRDPLVFRRFNHWWEKLPPAETRLLPGN